MFLFLDDLVAPFVNVAEVGQEIMQYMAVLQKVMKHSSTTTRYIVFEGGTKRKRGQ